jgi:hypothetical protein
MKTIIFISGARAELAPYRWLRWLIKLFPLNTFGYQPKAPLELWKKRFENGNTVKIFHWDRSWKEDTLREASHELSVLITQQNDDVFILCESIGADIVYRLPEKHLVKVSRIVSLAPTYNPSRSIPSQATHIVTPFDSVAPTATLLLWPLDTMRHIFSRKGVEHVRTWILRHDRFYPQKNIFWNSSKDLEQEVRELFEL